MRATLIATRRGHGHANREKPFGRAEWKRLSDTVDMDTSQQSRSGEEPGRKAWFER